MDLLRSTSSDTSDTLSQLLPRPSDTFKRDRTSTVEYIGKGVVERKGHILKRGKPSKLGFNKHWKERFFVISKDNPGQLRYFSQPDQSELLGSLVLADAVCYVKAEEGPKARHILLIRPQGGKIYPLNVSNKTDYHAWQVAIQDHGCKLKPCLKQGKVKRLNTTTKKFQERYFCLYDDHIDFYKGENEDDPAGEIDLSKEFLAEALPAEESIHPFSFQVMVSQDHGAAKHICCTTASSSTKEWLHILGRLMSIRGIKQHNLHSLKEGYLYKKGAIDTSWKKRFCVLVDGCMLYYKKKGEMTEAGVIDIPGGTTCLHAAETFVALDHKPTVIPPNKYGLSLKPTEDENERTYWLAADNKEDADEWIDLIQKQSLARPSTREPNSVLEGYLYKAGSHAYSKAWNKRYFVLIDKTYREYKKKWDKSPHVETQLTPDTMCGQVFPEMDDEEEVRSREPSLASRGIKKKKKGFFTSKKKEKEKAQHEAHMFSLIASEDADEAKVIYAGMDDEGMQSWVDNIITIVKAMRKDTVVQKVWPDAIKEGYCFKPSKAGGDQKKYIVLFPTEVVFYKKKWSERAMYNKRVRVVGGHTIADKHETNPLAFTLTESESEGVKTFTLVGQSSVDRDDWIKKILEVASRSTFSKSENSLLEGFMWKTGKNNMGWYKRYFILLPDCLQYWKNILDDQWSGSIPIYSNTQVEEREDPHRHVFCVTASADEGERQYRLSHATMQGKRKWMKKITDLANSKTFTGHSNAYIHGYMQLHNRKRYFALYKNSLQFFKRQTDEAFLDEIPIPAGAVCIEDEENPLLFSLQSSLDESAKVFVINVLEEKRNDWMEAINTLISSKPIVPVKSGSVKEGYLRRKNMLGKWQFRYYCLMSDSVLIFKRKMDEVAEKTLAFNTITTVQSTDSDKDGPLLGIQIPPEEVPPGEKQKEKLHKATMQAKSARERDDWVKAIGKVLGKGVACLFGADLQSGVELSPWKLVPEVVVQCSEYLKENGLQTEGIFRVPGSNADIQAITASYESGKDATSQINDVHTVAGVFKLYLRMLSEPVIPFNLYDEFIASNTIQDVSRKLKIFTELLTQLPDENVSTLNVVIDLLVTVAKHSDVNLMNVANCAMVFAPSLLKKMEKNTEHMDPMDAVKAAQSMKKDMELAQKVIETFIEHQTTLFPIPFKKEKKLLAKDKLLFKGSLWGAVLRSPYEGIPKIVVQCVRYLQINAMQLEGIFRVPGNNDLIHDYEHGFETGAKVQLTDAHSVAGILKLYFRMLIDPIVPFAHYDSFIAVEEKKSEVKEETYAALRECILKLPEENQRTLSYLISFLVHVTEFAQKNLMGVDNCAMVFAPSLLRKCEKKEEEKQANMTPAESMKYAQAMVKTMERSQHVIALLMQGYGAIFEGISAEVNVKEGCSEEAFSVTVEASSPVVRASSPVARTQSAGNCSRVGSPIPKPSPPPRRTIGHVAPPPRRPRVPSMPPPLPPGKPNSPRHLASPGQPEDENLSLLSQQATYGGDTADEDERDVSDGSGGTIDSLPEFDDILPPPPQHERESIDLPPPPLIEE